MWSLGPMYRFWRCLSNRWNTLTLVQFLFLKMKCNCVPSCSSKHFHFYIFQWKRLLNLLLCNLPGWSNLTSSIFSTWELYAVIWNTTSGESWIQVMFTGTKSSLTCVHFTVPELDVVTWKTSAQSRQIGILSKLNILIENTYCSLTTFKLCKTKYINK